MADSPTNADNCIFCLGAKQNPVKLKCEHSFCKPCFDRHKMYRHYQWANKCPICRMKLKIRNKLADYVNDGVETFVVRAEYVRLTIGYHTLVNGLMHVVQRPRGNMSGSIDPMRGISSVHPFTAMNCASVSSLPSPSNAINHTRSLTYDEALATVDNALADSNVVPYGEGTMPNDNASPMYQPSSNANYLNYDINNENNANSSFNSDSMDFSIEINSTISSESSMELDSSTEESILASHFPVENLLDDWPEFRTVLGDMGLQILNIIRSQMNFNPDNEESISIVYEEEMLSDEEFLAFHQQQQQFIIDRFKANLPNLTETTVKQHQHQLELVRIATLRRLAWNENRPNTRRRLGNPRELMPRMYNILEQVCRHSNELIRNVVRLDDSVQNILEGNNNELRNRHNEEGNESMGSKNDCATSSVLMDTTTSGTDNDDFQSTAMDVEMEDSPSTSDESSPPPLISVNDDLPDPPQLISDSFLRRRSARIAAAMAPRVYLLPRFSQLVPRMTPLNRQELMPLAQSISQGAILASELRRMAPQSTSIRPQPISMASQPAIGVPPPPLPMEAPVAPSVNPINVHYDGAHYTVEVSNVEDEHSNSNGENRSLTFKCNIRRMS